MLSDTRIPRGRSPGPVCQSPQGRGLGPSADWGPSLSPFQPLASVWGKKCDSEPLYPRAPVWAHLASVLGQPLFPRLLQPVPHQGPPTWDTLNGTFFRLENPAVRKRKGTFELQSVAPTGVVLK